MKEAPGFTEGFFAISPV